MGRAARDHNKPVGRPKMQERSKVTKRTIWRFEVGDVRPHERTLRDVIEAFEADGIVFIPEKEGIHSATVAFFWGVADPALRGDASSKKDAARLARRSGRRMSG